MGPASSQIFFIPKPSITSENCGNLQDWVFLVIGGYGGIGFELCKILYEHNAIVCVAGRDEAKGNNAVKSIEDAQPNSCGHIKFLLMDMSDLQSVKSGVEEFSKEQKRLDVLVQNAGCMYKGSSATNFNHLSMSTNCVGPTLLYRLLLPTLTETATQAPSQGSVRVLLTGSIAIHVNVPSPGGMHIDDETGAPKDQDQLLSYGQSKVGNMFLAKHYSKDTAHNGIVHACYNPGNLTTDLQRYWKGWDINMMKRFLFFPSVYGAYTQLWAALSREMAEPSESYVYPWGRLGSLPANIEASMQRGENGDRSLAEKFVGWCERTTDPYMA